jgi:hypothetical protein
VQEARLLVPRQVVQEDLLPDAAAVELEDDAAGAVGEQVRVLGDDGRDDALTVQIRKLRVRLVRRDDKGDVPLHDESAEDACALWAPERSPKSADTHLTKHFDELVRHLWSHINSPRKCGLRTS